MRIQFCEFDEEFFRLSGVWLRDNEIKKLTMSQDIAEADRIAWYQSLQFRKDYLIEGIMANDTPVGAIGLKNIDKDYGTAEYFGYIGNKKYFGRGIGNLMMVHMHETALLMSLKLLYLKVEKTNVRAYRLYKRHRYMEISNFKGICIMVNLL